MKFEVVTSLAGLQARAADWAALHSRLPTAGLFNSPEWVLNWLASFAPSGPLHGVFASDEAGLQAVLPLVPARSRWRRVPVRALSACTNAHSVRSSLLFAPERRDEVFDCLMRSLGGHAAWDVLLLDGCGVGEAAPPALVNELPADRWQHSRLLLPADWATYLASRSRVLRRNLRRAEGDLQALGSVRFEVIECSAPRLFDLWVEVDRASWKADAGETVDGEALTASYYRGMLESLAAAGRLFSGVLSLDGLPIAVLVGARDKGVLYTLKTAMRLDLSSARLSLGLLVMARLLEAASHRPDITAVDFVSKADYSDRWTNDNLDFERRVALASSWRGQLAGWLDRTARRRTAVLGASH